LFEQIAALDIGTTSVKLVRLKKTLRDFQVLSFASEEINAEEENHDEALRDALQRLIENNPLNGHIVVSNLPMERSILRVIKFPFADIEKIAEAIPFEAQENIPFNIDDLVMDFQMLPGSDPEEGRILLAASHHETVHDFIRTFEDHDVQLQHIGLESNALFETYRHFSKVGDENIIQIDFGHNKTIMNIISNNTLVYTRCIYIGTGLMIRSISEILGISYKQATTVFERLNLDLTSYENNVHRHFYKTLEIPKPKLKLIFNSANEIIHDLSEQIMLTLKSFFVDYGSIEFSRVMLSGGGSNLIGIGGIFSEHISAPIVALPFLDDYQDEHMYSIEGSFVIGKDFECRLKNFFCLGKLIIFQ